MNKSMLIRLGLVILLLLHPVIFPRSGIQDPLTFFASFFAGFLLLTTAPISLRAAKVSTARQVIGAVAVGAGVGIIWLSRAYIANLTSANGLYMHLCYFVVGIIVTLIANAITRLVVGKN